MALWIINILTELQVQNSCSSLQPRQPPAETHQLVLSPCSQSGTWPVSPRARAQFPCLCLGLHIHPFPLTAQLQWGGHSPALPGKHCDTTATKSLGTARGEHPIALGLQQPEKRQNSIFTAVLEVQLDFCLSCWKQLFSMKLLYPHLILEQMAFQQILFQNWDYLWAKIVLQFGFKFNVHGLWIGMISNIKLNNYTAKKS